MSVSSNEQQAKGEIHIENGFVLKQPTDGCFPCFIREMAALKLLEEAGVPNIVPLHEVRSDGTLVLEQFTGDLTDVLDDSITEEQLVFILYQVLVAMANMQNLGISHRDIKPENILIKNTQIAICDFGLCRYFCQGKVPRQMTMQTQTSLYRSPELLFNELPDADIGPVYPNNLDVWSLGITALKLLDSEFVPIYMNDLELDELYDVYEQYYGSEGQLRNGGNGGNEVGVNEGNEVGGNEGNEVIELICRMLTINSNERPDALELLSDPIFDNLRIERELVDAEAFHQQRVERLLQMVPITESNQQILKLLNAVKQHFQYNNIESMYLAVCIIYMLPEGSRNVNWMAINALAVAVFDNEYIEMDQELTMKLIKDINYQLFQPVTDPRVVQRLDKLLSTV